MEINYLNGDATSPNVDGNKIIVHVSNDIGGWGRGFVLAISSKWKTPEQEYKAWAKAKHNFELGEVQFVQVEPTIWVANLIGQRDIKIGKDGRPPVRYDAIQHGLKRVSSFAEEIEATVHMPRIGCGLAGGTWNNIEPHIISELISNSIDTYVYDFNV